MTSMDICWLEFDRLLACFIIACLFNYHCLPDPSFISCLLIFIYLTYLSLICPYCAVPSCLPVNHCTSLLPYALKYPAIQYRGHREGVLVANVKWVSLPGFLLLLVHLNSCDCWYICWLVLFYVPVKWSVSIAPRF